MKRLKAIRSVYAYYFPEIRKLIDELTKKFPHEVFLKSIEPGLDNFHFPIIRRYLKFNQSLVPYLKDFRFRYVTNGSNEAIFHLLVALAVAKQKKPLYIFKGEYEGYQGYAQNLGIKVKVVDSEKIDPASLKKGFWFISNPSARNGKIIPNKVILGICRAGHEVVLDLTYIGLTRSYQFEVNHPNILAVITSLSKPFGLFYYRIGFAFARDKIATLEPNIWFKNIFSLLIADKILSSFKPQYFYRKYRPIQQKIIREIKSQTGIEIKPSDVVILGYLGRKNTQKLGKSQIEEIERFQRGDFYRFCLTPYFLKEERYFENSF